MAAPVVGLGALAGLGARAGALLAALAGLGALAAALLAAALLRARPRARGAVAFLHPVGADGGGGERVLWCAVRALQRARPGVRVLLVTDCPGGAAAFGPEALRRRALERFGVELAGPVEAVALRGAWLAGPAPWPRFTLLGQALGQALVGLEALARCRPEVLVDTAGLAFALPVARLAGCAAAAYVHYPMVSTDMLGRVRGGVETYNNQGGVARSAWRTRAKLGYYRAFALLYGAVGGCAQAVMVNSTWTLGHVGSLWWGWGGPAGPGAGASGGRRAGARLPALVHPPCNTQALLKWPVAGAGARDRREGGAGRPPYIISVAQFRPEKDHALQLRSFAEARRRGSPAVLGARLVLVGGCRNDGDEARVARLRALAAELGLGDAVEFRVNASYAELQGLLGAAAAGLHTMLDEHFGIVVVEYMAAGAVPIAHRSAGPEMDIVRPQDGRQTGFLAREECEYAEAMERVLEMRAEEWEEMAAAGRARAGRFSDAAFERKFLAALEPLLPPP